MAKVKGDVKVGQSFFIPASSLRCGSVHNSTDALAKAAEENKSSYFGYTSGGGYAKEAKGFEVKIVRKLTLRRETVKVV